MSRSTRWTHRRTGRRRPRLEALESRHVLSFAVVAVGPPPTALPPAPPAEIHGLPGGVAVDPPPAPAGGGAVGPPPPPRSMAPPGGVPSGPPRGPPAVPPPGGVAVGPPPALPPAEIPGLLRVVAVDPSPGALLTTPPTVVTVTF